MIYIVILCIFLTSIIFFYFNKFELQRIRKRNNVNEWLNVVWANKECVKEGFEITEKMIASLKKAFVDVLHIPFEKYKQNDSLLYCVSEKKLDEITNVFLKYEGFNHAVKPGEIEYWDKRVSEICASILIYHCDLTRGLYDLE